MAKYFYVTTNKLPLSYACNEEIVFSIFARENRYNLPEWRNVKWEIWQDDGAHLTGNGAFLNGRPITVKTSISRPGFVRLQVTALKPDGTVAPEFEISDSGAGADVDKIALSGRIPEDFNEYWDKIRKLVDGFTPVLLEKVPYYKDVPAGFKCYDVKISTPIDTNASGYLTIPEGDGPFAIELSFRGYSVAGAGPAYRPGIIHLCVNAHGFENGFSNAALEEKYPHLVHYGFNEEENARPETSYWQNMIIRNLIAGKWLKSLDQWNKKTFLLLGGSQGAFQAVNYAAIDHDVTYLDIFIPWMSDLRSVEDGFMTGWRPKCADGLDYFDTAIQIANVTCPVKLSGFLGDYVCPPKTIMALYNRINTKKKLTFTQSGTHGYRPIEVQSQHMWVDPDFSVHLGKYRHYKGTEYEVIAIGKDSETLEDTVFYTDGEKFWSRPLNMWYDLVLYNGSMVRRFEEI